MSVELEIANSALVKLGGTPLVDFNQNSKEGLLCRTQYPRIRDSVLRSGIWSFARRRVLLTPASVSLEFIDTDDLNVFILPVDCVRVVTVNEGCERYRIEGRYLLLRDVEARVHYISNAVPDHMYDANFKEAVANMLAADLCYAVTQSISLKEGLVSSGQYWLDQARSHTSQEVTPENFVFDDFLNARRGSHEIYP